MIKLFKWYGHLLNTKPLRTKTITAFCTLSLADLTCQVIEKKFSKDGDKVINWKRTLRQGLFCLIAAPWLHYYTTKMIPTFFPIGTKYRLTKTVTFDSCIHMPMYVTALFSYLDIMSGKSLKQTYNEVKIKVNHSIKKAWNYRPWVMFINFLFIPIPFRVLYMNIFGYFINTYLSWVQNVRLNYKNEEKCLQVERKEIKEEFIVIEPQNKELDRSNNLSEQVESMLH